MSAHNGDAAAGDFPLSAGFVLLVEDNALVARTLTAVLDDAGLPTRCLADGESAWELMESERGADVRVVVCDVGLPGISGKELLSRFTRTYPGVPVLVVSGYTEPKLVGELLEAGARSVIGKPVDAGELVSQVSEHFSRS